MNDNWYKLDNVAKVFLAAYNKRNPRSLRVSCILTEDIDEKLLQEALINTIRIRPQFQVRIRRGFFWHYLEQTDIQPIVSKEVTGPCPALYGDSYKGLLHYRVTYYGKRINLDASHAISDGTGALLMLKLLTLNYIKLRYPGKYDEISLQEAATTDDRFQNSYDHFYDDSTDAIPKTILNKKPKAYQLQSRKLPYNQLQYTEIHLSASALLKKSKELNVSLTSYLGANLMLAIQKGMPYRLRKRPITITMPVNLRNYYPSETLRNFFNNVDVSHVFDGTETLESLSKEFDHKLKSSLDPELIKSQMNRYQSMEQLIFTRMVPLFIKQPVVRFFSKKETARVTAVLSNLGQIKMPDEISPLISGFTDYCSTDNLFITATSYKDDLVLGIASAHAGTGPIRRLISALKETGTDVTVYTTEVIK